MYIRIYVYYFYKIYSHLLIYYTVLCEPRSRVVRDCDYRSVKSNAINNHGGITRAAGRRRTKEGVAAFGGLPLMPMPMSGFSRSVTPAHPYPRHNPEIHRSDFALPRRQTPTRFSRHRPLITLPFTILHANLKR